MENVRMGVGENRFEGDKVRVSDSMDFIDFVRWRVGFSGEVKDLESEIGCI